MKRIGIIILSLLLIGFCLTYCSNKEQSRNPKEEQAKALIEQQYASSSKWYKETKEQILKQAALKADCTISTYNENRSFKTEHFYLNGHEFMSKGFSDGILSVEIFFSKNKEFELRREICENGASSFEGIVYQGEFVGLSTWRNCNGNISEQGNRYNDKKIGIWKKFDRDEQLTEVNDYKNAEKLDSLPVIHN